MTRLAVTPVADAAHGVVPAAGLLLDIELIGAQRARERVLAMWQDRSRLLELRGRWLLTLPEPVELRSERAPGQVLVAADGGLAQPGSPAAPGVVSTFTGGIARADRIDELAEVDVSAWLDRSALDVHLLEPCDAPVPSATVLALSPLPAPNLRLNAGIGVAPRRRSWAYRPPRRRFLVALVLLVLALWLLVAMLERHDDAPSPAHASTVTSAEPSTTAPPPVTFSVGPGEQVTLPQLAPISVGAIRTPSTSSDWGRYAPGWVVGAVILVRLLGAAAAHARRRAVAVPAAPARARPRRDGLLARLFVRTGLDRRFVSGRRLRYLRRLSDDFDRGDWDSALRSAIGLGSGANGALTLRMPRPRRELRLGGSGGRASVGFADRSVYAYLRELYLEALRNLETQGRVDEAAFLQAEILRDTRGAVSLLERNGRYAVAAQLAEARELDPALLVRLWFRAGDRQRAIDIARARDAFADAIERLTDVDADAARALRAEWVQSCQGAGDHAGAVRAAWPSAELRAVVQPDLRAGLEHHDSAWFLAYLVCGFGAAADVARGLELLGACSGSSVRDRDLFVETLAGLEPVDRVADRRLCGAALRALLRDGTAATTAKTRKRLLGTLRERADRLLVIDLPPVPRRPTLVDAAEHAVIEFPDRPGELPLHDAVVLADGRMLLAHGEAGVRLLSASGRVAARWDRRADRIVVADHGGVALVVGEAGMVREIARLELATTRLREWAVLETSFVLDSFDGGLLTAVDPHGIAFVDTLAPTPRPVWRELEDKHTVVAINRSTDALTAFVRSRDPARSAPLWELWSWELPSLMLRVRHRVDIAEDVTFAVTLPGELMTLGTAEAGVLLERSVGWADPVLVRSGLPERTTLQTSGPVCALVLPFEERTELELLVSGRELVTVRAAAGAELRVHSHAGIATVHDAGGNLMAFDQSSGAILGAYRTAR